MAIAGTLEIQMLANMARLTDDMAKAKGIVGDAVGAIEKILGTIGVGFSAHVLLEKINSITEGMAKLQDASEKTGASVENLSKLKFFAGVSGSSIDGVTQALAKLSKNMAASGNDSAAASQALKFLGLSAKDTAGNLKDPSALFTEISQKLIGYQDGAGKAAIAQALFGKAGVEMLPTLKKMAELGDVEASVTTEQAAAAEEYQIKLARLDQQKQILWNTVTSALLPSMKSLVDAMLDASKNTDSLGGKAKDLAADGSITRWADKAALAMGATVDVVVFAVAQVSALYNGLKVAYDIVRMMSTVNLNPETRAANYAELLKDAETSRAATAAALKGITTEYADAVAAKIALRKEDDASATASAETQKKALNFTPGDAAKIAAELKLYTSALQKYEEQLGKVNQMSDVEKAIYELTVGSLKLLTTEHKAAILAVAGEVDERKQLIKVLDAELAHQVALFDLQEKLALQRQGLNRSSKDTLDQMQFEISMIGRTVDEQMQANEMRKIDIALREAQRKASQDLADAGGTALADELDRLSRWAAAYKQQVGDLTAFRLAKERSWETGAQQALNDYITNATNAAQQSKDLWTKAFQGMEDALVKFATTGKLDFKSLANSIIADIIRIQVRENITGPLASTLSGTSGASGGSGTTGTSGGSLASGASSISNFSMTPYGNALTKVSNTTMGNNLFGGGVDEAAYAKAVLDGQDVTREMFRTATTELGSAASSLADAMDSYGGYVAAVYNLTQGKIFSAIGAAIGQNFGGPIGSFIGSTIGGLLDGGGNEITNSPPNKFFTYLNANKSGLVAGEGGNYSNGTLGLTGAGTYGFALGGTRSDGGQWDTGYGTLTADQTKTLSNTVSAVFDAIRQQAKTVGLSTTGIDTGTFAAGGSWTTGDFSTVLTSAIHDLSDKLATSLIPNLKDFQVQGETLSGTFSRLVADLGGVKGMFELMGKTFSASGADAIKVSEDIIKAFGGSSNLNAAFSSYYKDFYSQSERTANATKQVSDALTGLGVTTMPATREAFRHLVEQQDLSTEAGRNMFASLMALNGAFAAVVPATAAAAAAEAQAAQAAAAAKAQATAVASQGYGLQTQLLQAQGDTVSLRARELALLDPSNRAIQQQIWALQDQQVAAQAAAQATSASASAAQQAAADQQRAADQIKSAWQSATDSIMGEVARIRGLIGAPGQNMASAQAQFAISTAQARAGDIEAAKLLPGLSRAILDMATASAVTSLDLRRIEAQIAGSLSITAGGAAAQYGLVMPAYATGTDFVPVTGPAMLHRGERVMTAAANDELVMEIRELRKDNAAMRGELVAISRNSKRTADIVEKSDAIGPAPARAAL